MADVLQAIKDLVHTYPPEVEAYLFGSRARGDSRPDSDWDVLLLFDHEEFTDEDYLRCYYPLEELGWTLNAEIAPVYFSKRKWEESKNHTLFYNNVLKDRIRL